MEAWAVNPVTVAVRRYLMDYAMLVRLGWAGGKDRSAESAAWVDACEDLAEIDHASVATFYEALGDKANALKAGRAALNHFEREDDDGDDNTA